MTVTRLRSIIIKELWAILRDPRTRIILLVPPVVQLLIFGLATTLEVTGGFDRPPLERSAGVARLYDQARQIARDLGQDLGEGSTGGGSDGNFTAALGVPTLDGLGAIGDGAHALHEHVEVDALPDRAALIAGLIAHLR